MRKKLFSASLLILLTLNIILTSLGSPGLTLTIQTNKTEYNIEEKVIVSGSFKTDDTPVTDALIGIQINNPSDFPIMYRTQTTGTTPILSEIEIIEVYPSTELGNPQYSFRKGTLASFTVKVRNNNPESRFVYLALTCYYEPYTIPFTAIVPFPNAPIDGGKTRTFTPSIPIPSDAIVGAAKVYCSAYKVNTPANLGYPYCPEVSADFLITASEAAAETGEVSTQSATPGSYNLMFEIPGDTPIGTYVAYASTRYSQEIAFALNTFNVISLPRLQVTPRLSIMRLDETAQLNIAIADVANLTSWEMKVYYKSTVLNATQVVQGPFLSAVGATTFTILGFTDAYNSTHGRIWMNCSLNLRTIGANGSGVLATITFKAKASTGSTAIDLADTKLADNKTPPASIRHTCVGGIVSMGIHDIAVTNIVQHKTVVGEEITLPVKVTVKNNGHYTETFNVTLYINVTSVQTKIFTLQSGQSNETTFYWNTMGFTLYDTYVISAYAASVPEEANVGDNSLTDGTITLVIPGDINADKVVDIFDAVLLANAAGSRPGYPNWNPNCDINCDEIVDVFDAVKLAANAGRSVT